MKYHKHRSWQGRYSGQMRLGREDAGPGLYRRYRHGGSRGGFGGSGEGKRFFERGQFKYALLELLASEPMHGYQLIKAMEEKTGGLYTPSPGSVYPNLQLLEDMQLIGSNEADGKKLYHITSEGRAHLSERAGAKTEASGERWDHRGRGRHGHGGGRGGRHHLREFMKEWSEVIYLMARAADAAKENPSSEQAVQFQELMSEFQSKLNAIVDSLPPSGIDESAAPAVEPDGSSNAPQIREQLEPHPDRGSDSV